MDFIEVRIKGWANQRWWKHLMRLKVIHLENGSTVLKGYVEDDAALFGLLDLIRNLGFKLEAITYKAGPTG